MTEIAFHFNAPDKAGYVARLLRKAVQAQAEIVVCGVTEFQELSAQLWNVGATDFVAHANHTDAEHLVAASSVLLLLRCTDARHRQVVLNLGNSIPDGFSEFDRLIEVVTADEDDRRAARARWKHYADRGYAVVSHDATPQGAS